MKRALLAVGLFIGVCGGMVVVAWAVGELPVVGAIMIGMAVLGFWFGACWKTAGEILRGKE